MILIIGGAYQGKLEYAKRTFSLEQEEICFCGESDVDFSKRCIYQLEEFTLFCVEQGIEPTAYFRQTQDKWRNSILICQDIFCGVVPMESKLRLWRQETGRLAQYLTAEADQVIRVFCGLEQRLK